MGHKNMDGARPMPGLFGYRWFLFFGIAWIGLEFFILGPFSAVPTGDNADVIIPDLMSFAFSEDGFALWNRFSMAGTDRRSQGPLSPLDIWLFNHLPAWIAYQLRVLSQIALAAVAMRVICRKWLQMEASGALIAGLGYALIVGAGGRVYMSALAYLPLFVLTIGLVLDNKRSVLRWLSLALATALFGLSAHMGFLFPFPQALIGIWFLVVDRRASVADWVIIVTAPTLAALLRIPDYLSMAADAPLSQRHVTGEVNDGDALWQAILGGKQILIATPEKIVVTAFAIAACVLLWRHRMVRRLMLAVALIAGTVIGVSVVQGPLFDLFPFAKGFNLGRLWTVLSFLAVMLAGFGVQGLAARLSDRPIIYNARILGRSRRRVVLGLALSALFLASLHYKYGNTKDWISQGNMVQNFASKQLLALAERIRGEAFPSRVAAYQIYPNYLHAYGIETAGGYLSMVGKRNHDFWGGVLAPSLRPGNTQKINKLAFENGNRMMLNSDNRAPTVTLADYFNLNLLSLANVKYFVSRDPLTDPSLTLLDGAQRPWNSRSVKEKIKASAWANFRGRDNLYIYQNNNALDRFFITPQVRSYAGSDALLRSLGKASPINLRSTAFVLQDDFPAAASSALGKLSRGVVSLVHYDSDRFELSVEADGPALLVVTSSYHGKWRAQIDGLAAPIFPVDHAFMGVFLPVGASRIVFQYADATY